MAPADRPAADAGFTLIEVIVSFVILALVMGSATLSLSYSARLHRNGEAKRLAMVCAQRVLAERFDRRAGLPSSETGADGADCRWRITRGIVRPAFTASGRTLMSLRLEILDQEGRPREAFETYYVEALP